MTIMSDVRVPGLGNVPKPALIAAGAASVGIIAYAWFKHKSTGNPSADLSTPSDSSSTDTSGIDPSTGVPYADEYGYMNSGYSFGGVFDPSTGSTVTSGSGGTGVVTITTNAQWAQAAQSYLASIGGYDATAVAAALGAGLLGHYMTPDQVGIWNAAIAFEGYPPQGSPPLNTTPPGGGGSNPPPPKTGPLPAPTGLRSTAHTRSTVTLTWNAVAGATHYRVYRSDVATNIGDSADNVVTVGGLRANTVYKFHVRALDSQNTLGNSSSTISVRTSK